MTNIKHLLPIALLALSSIATAANNDSRSVVVKYGDLNLNTQAGLESLHKRIRNAAESVCSPLETRILGLREAYESCVNAAIEQGVAQVGVERLAVVVTTHQR